MGAYPATDLEIQRWAQQHFGFYAEAAWIAHCKRLCSLPAADIRTYQQSQFNPCPLVKQAAVIKAFRYFGMIPTPLSP